MPKQKLKTHKGAQKRFKVNGAGLLMQPKGMKSHFRRRRSDRVKRQLDKMLVSDATTAKRILKRALPYGA
jgi:large subunit ribosomal protein L35